MMVIVGEVLVGVNVFQPEHTLILYIRNIAAWKTSVILHGTRCIYQG